MSKQVKQVTKEKMEILSFFYSGILQKLKFVFVENACIYKIILKKTKILSKNGTLCVLVVSFHKN